MEELKHSRKGCLNRVRNSFGVRDAHKLIRKNHWYNIGQTVSEADFYAIVRRVNLLLAEELAQGRTVQLPSRMGKLELRKYKVGADFVDGKLRITYPPNWAATWKLWREDPEAKKNKVILRHENPYVYRIYYDKWNAVYDNKCFYQFTLNSFIQKKLSQNIKQGKVDTLW